MFTLAAILVRKAVESAKANFIPVTLVANVPFVMNAGTSGSRLLKQAFL